MKLSGFTFIRNAVRYDYPVVESIRSILPIVDEFIVNVSPDDDGTLKLIESIGSPKIKILQSQWNPNVATGGYVYAQQTNIAMFNCSGKWAFYVQADEVIHEEDLPRIMEYVDRYADDDRVEGLALNELTFWGDYKTIINVYPWRYSRRCWVVKPHRFVLSRGDAAGFTVHPKYKERGRKIRAVSTGARVFHYSCVRSLKAFTEKTRGVFKHWSDKYTPEQIEQVALDYYNFQRCFLGPYDGTHPAVMQQRIQQHPIHLDLDSPKWNRSLTRKDRERLLRTWLVRHFDDRFLGRGSYTLLNDRP
jgi:glycosyltransferase involved in cell wall biosynthesis